MEDVERERLLDRADRPGAVGGEIPERVDVQGSTVSLREFVLEVNRYESVPAAEGERVDDLLTELRRERLQRRQRLQRAELTRSEGESLVETIEGLDRAVNALESLDDVGLTEAERQQTVADARAWTSFLRNVL